MSTYTQQSDITPRTLARSSSINDLDTAVAAAFALLPDEDVLKRDLVSFAVDSGAADAYVVTMTHTQTSYIDGFKVRMRPLNTNTGASTINVDGLGVKSIKLPDSSDPNAGDINAGAPVEMIYSSATGHFHISPNSTIAAATAVSQAAAAGVSASAASASASAASASASAASSSETNINNSISAHNSSVDSHASSAQTLTNKTLTSPVLNTGVSGTAIIDSDTLTGASSTKLADSESIKNYVDNAIAAAVPTGTVKAFAGAETDIPDGYLACLGQEVSQTTYAALYAVIQDTWNTGGEAVGNFSLPPSAKFILGSDGDAGSFPPGTIGDGSGSTEGHLLSTDELPEHTHSIFPALSGSTSGAGNYIQGATTFANYGSISTAVNDSDEDAHTHDMDDYKPVYASMLFIIKT